MPHVNSAQSVICTVANKTLTHWRRTALPGPFMHPLTLAAAVRQRGQRTPLPPAGKNAKCAIKPSTDVRNLGVLTKGGFQVYRRGCLGSPCRNPPLSGREGSGRGGVFVRPSKPFFQKAMSSGSSVLSDLGNPPGFRKPSAGRAVVEGRKHVSGRVVSVN
jgi:hypothetical protein